MRRLHILLLVQGFILLLFACEGESDLYKKIEIGRWELTEATRSNKPTETLGGTFMVFAEDGKMETNLPIGGDAPTPYEVVKNEIRQQSPMTIKYVILECSDSTLSLALELRGIPFQMKFKKSTGTTQDLEDPPSESEIPNPPADSL